MSDVKRWEADDLTDPYGQWVSRCNALAAQLAEYENVIIPSWKREEALWKQDEADAVEYRRVLVEELDAAVKKREEYALQVCLLLDTMKEAGVHVDEKWCWCHPQVEDHSGELGEVRHECICPVCGLRHGGTGGTVGDF